MPRKKAAEKVKEQQGVRERVGDYLADDLKASGFDISVRVIGDN